MTSYKSKPTAIHASSQSVADFFADIRHLEKIMPEQIENWTVENNTCMFDIKNIGRLAMTRQNDKPRGFLEFISAPQSRVEFSLIFHLDNADPKNIHGYFEIQTEVNPFIEMMVKRPLTNFVSILSQNLAMLLE